MKLDKQLFDGPTARSQWHKLSKEMLSMAVAIVLSRRLSCASRLGAIQADQPGRQHHAVRPCQRRSEPYRWLGFGGAP